MPFAVFIKHLALVCCISILGVPPIASAQKKKKSKSSAAPQEPLNELIDETIVVYKGEPVFKGSLHALELAKQAYDQKNYKRALTLAKVSVYSDNPSLNKFQHLEEAVHQPKLSADRYFLAARAQAGLKRYGDALETVLQVRGFNPTLSAALYNSACYASRLKDLVAAAGFLKDLAQDIRSDQEKKRYVQLAPTDDDLAELRKSPHWQAAWTAIQQASPTANASRLARRPSVRQAGTLTISPEEVKAWEGTPYQFALTIEEGDEVRLYLEDGREELEKSPPARFIEIRFGKVWLGKPVIDIAWSEDPSSKSTVDIIISNDLLAVLKQADGFFKSQALTLEMTRYDRPIDGNTRIAAAVDHLTSKKDVARAIFASLWERWPSPVTDVAGLEKLIEAFDQEGAVRDDHFELVSRLKPKEPRYKYRLASMIEAKLAYDGAAFDEKDPRHQKVMTNLDELSQLLRGSPATERAKYAKLLADPKSFPRSGKTKRFQEILKSLR